MTSPKNHEHLITESTVEAFERARRESRAPARDDAVSVGALNELIEMLRGARAVWHGAVAALSDPGGRAQLTREIAALTRQVDALASAVRTLGGAPPEDDAGDQQALPFGTRDLDYVAGDEEILAGVVSDRERLRQARNTAAAGARLPEVRSLIESLRI